MRTHFAFVIVSDGREEDMDKRKNMGGRIVISGISGTFPCSEDISVFRDNLFNKVDMVRPIKKELRHIDRLPERSATILNLEQFDLGYFGVPSLHTDFMDPVYRKALEKTIEAIMDAGYHPTDLEGTDTAVIGGTCWEENQSKAFYQNLVPSTDLVIGNQRSILPERISHYLKLSGSALAIDTACSTTSYSLECAYALIKSGLCEKVLVCGTNLCRNPKTTLQFVKLGVLSQDGTCRCFDDGASGYVRSEAVVTMLLERAKDAKRIYAEVIYTKTNCDGYKVEGITYPSAELQQVLLEEFYNECKVDPNSLTFLEAHGTGTQIGDPQELNTIDAVFLKDRNRPLHIGSVKSNIGHAEPASALCSVVKVIIGMETGYIPPNLHYKTPRKGVEALEKGKLIVVTEKMLLPDNRGLFGVNSFGFGGANGHTLLFWNTKMKVNDGKPNDDLPRLLCVSSRTEEGVNVMLDDFKRCDAEYAYLIHQVFRKPFETHLYRGFGIYSKEGELERSLVKVGMKEKKLYLVFSNFDKELLKLGSEFMKLPTFAKTIEGIHNILLKRTGINLLEKMKTPMEENAVNQILIAAAIQISLANTLKQINLIAYRTIGVGSGEVVAAYAGNCLTLEQTIQTIFYIAFDANNSSNKNKQVLEKKSFFGKNNNVKWIPTREQDPLETLAKHFTNNIVSTTNGWNLKDLLTKDAVPLVIGTGVENMSEIKNIYLVDPNSKELIQNFLSTLGSLYEYGFDMQLDKLYPTIELPVSRGTPMLSPLIKWNHLRDCNVIDYKDINKINNESRTVHIFPKMSEWSFITGHLIEGRNLFPAAGYLYLVWKTLVEMRSKGISETVIVFEDVRFLRAVNLSNVDLVELTITIEDSSHTFQIVEDGIVVVTGKVFEKLNKYAFSNFESQPFQDEDLTLGKDDVYKELRLRGYYYRDLFRGVQRCSVDATKAIVEWNENWIAFLDCLLQVIILQQDTRDMYLPTCIHQIMIDAPKHLSISAKQNTVHVEANTIFLKAGGVEIKCVSASSVPRKRTKDPALEIYKFIGNESHCNVEDSVRALVQFVFENSDRLMFKVVEVCSEEMKQDQLLCPLMEKALGDVPFVQQELLVLSNKPMELPHITVQNKSLNVGMDCFILIVPNLLETIKLSVALNAIKVKEGFIISRETLDTDLSKFNNTTLNVLCSHKTSEEILILLKPKQKLSNEVLTIDITDAMDDFQWIPKLQDLLKKNDRIIIYAQGDETSGILGLVNCLKREHYGHKLSTVFLMDEAPKFDPKLDFYKNQLDKNLLINVWKDGTWGTYRHLQMPQPQTVEKDHCYANVLTRGDLSSMTWLEGSLSADDPVAPEKELIHIYYSSLNFRDLMTTTAKIPPDVVTKNRIEQECVQGIEFSGRDSEGRAVMGMCQTGSLATLVQCDKLSIYPIPDDWTMEEAATVPVVYLTVMQAFSRISHLRSGQSILIHSGTGGVGQAAINLSLYYGLTVFVTVGTQEKRDFIKQHYPQIKEGHIGNSRDTSFKSMIRRYTRGRGVDYVLNSLAEEKLLASVRCLAKGGIFIEIGKFDLVNNNELALHLLEKNSEFTCLSADKLILTASSSKKRAFFDQFMDLIKRGAIKPLPRTVFPIDEVENAFKYMGQGKHIGKILIQIRDEEERKRYPIPKSLFKGLPRFYCKPACSYLLIGGLGGFGLELADFLVVRGAKKLILTSRSGINNGYQQYRIRIWKSYGVEVLTSTCNVSTEEGCRELLDAANNLGPVDGIFNLAIVLKDAAFDNQTVDDFKEVFSSKVFSTRHLDKISRKSCPNLRCFVVFSSLTSGRGNAGQTNYGMANSIMERICEKRRKEGYPALAIQWGAIGDVGVLAKADDSSTDGNVIIGVHQQRISSCLQVLDRFLTQEETIVSSMVVAKMKSRNETSNPVDVILNLLGKKRAFFDQFMDLIKRGAIKPLPRTVFPIDEVENAFKYMGQGKHIGKILIQIRDEEERKRYPIPKSLFKGLPRFYCKPACSYLLIGGLGGFGLELADFLVVRGAKKLILTSRSGINNGYQQYRIRIWKSYGVEVLTSTCNVSTEEGCRELLDAANNLGPVDGIFNLAIVLKDAAFDNQTVDDFKEVFSSKVFSTRHLDKISRKSCPNLRCFVVFSSLTSGRGNAGQTNYGMANSIMERICEKRRKEGYPALAIQWGAIGDVGVLAKADDSSTDGNVIIGVHQQRISSCLQVLDRFLTQEETIVSSMVVAKMKSRNETSNPVDVILNLLGITNINTISLHSTLPELGMDSIMAIEIKQALERDHQIFLTSGEIKALTLSKLKILCESREAQSTVNASKMTTSHTDISVDVQLLVPKIENEEIVFVPVLKLKTLLEDGENAPHIFALPGLIGSSTVLEQLCEKLKAHVSCLQFPITNEGQTISDMAESLLPHVISFDGDLIILAYSFGCVVATELLHLLALNGRQAKVVYVDGSPDMLRDFTKRNLPMDDKPEIQIAFVTLLITPYITHEELLQYQTNTPELNNNQEKLDYVANLLDKTVTSQYFKDTCLSIIHRILALNKYKPKMEKLKFPITLFKPTKMLVEDTTFDDNLSSLFENHVDVYSVEGNHVTMLENNELAVKINEICRNEL